MFEELLKAFKKVKERDKTITLSPGTMLNLSGHEDDDYYVVKRRVQAEVVGPKTENGLPLKVPGLGNQIVFLHLPETNSNKR